MKGRSILLAGALLPVVSLAAFGADALTERYQALKEELLTCEENVFAAKRDEMLGFLARPGETNALALVTFYLDVVNKDRQGVFAKPDCWALAEAVSRQSAAARRKYVQSRFWALNFSMQDRWGGAVDPAWTYEGRLAFAEEVMKDPLVPDCYAQARSAKFEALRLLGRDDELLAFFAAELAAATSPMARAALLNERADYYRAAARRYQDKSEPTLLAKARADLLETTESPDVYRDKREFGRRLVQLADVDIQLGDLYAARVALEKYVAVLPDGGRMRAEVDVKLGEVAYAEKDYAEAVCLWAPYAKGWQRDIEKTERMARALFALGRKAEALPYLETLAARGNKYAKLYYKYALEELRAARANGKPEPEVTEVLVSFDTEDFTNPRAADGVLALAQICEQEGIRAHFEVVGLMAEALKKWGRDDVIAAVRRHVIGTHTWSHSVHPDIMEESDRESYDDAYKTVFAHEKKSVETLKRVFGVDRVWGSVPPGNCEPYVSARVYADLGITIDQGATFLGRDAEDIWYAGLRRIPYGYCLEWFRDPGFVYEPEKLLDELATKRRFSIFCHPNRVWAKTFWDGINYNGTNACAFGEWKLSEEYTPEETELYLSRVRDILRRIKADPRFRIVTLPELVAAQKPRVAITPADLPAIKASFMNDFGPVREPASWCVADVFCAVVAFLRGETKYEPKNAYGFLYEPKGVSSPALLKAADLRAAARAIDVRKFLPTQVRVGGQMVGPADFLFAAIEILTTDLDAVVVEPCDQLGSFARLPELEKMNYRGTWVHTPEFRDSWVSDRLRWQLWTLRYE